MTKDLLWQGLAKSHQEDRPVDRMESNDVLSDQMKVRRPVLAIQLFVIAVCIVADAGDVVGQCIQPYVDNMAGIKVNRNAPLEAGTGHAQILQARQKEIVHHFILAGHRLDEFRMRVDMINEALCVFLHLEEIRIFILLMNGSAADRALVTVHDLRSGIECLTLRAVHALVLTQIDIALVIELFKDLLNLTLMIFIGGTNEAIIGGVHTIPDPADLTGRLIHKLLGCLAGAGSALLDLLTVLVRAGLKVHVVAVCALVACNAVCHDNLVGVADVRLA